MWSVLNSFTIKFESGKLLLIVDVICCCVRVELEDEIKEELLLLIELKFVMSFVELLYFKLLEFVGLVEFDLDDTTELEELAEEVLRVGIGIFLWIFDIFFV